MALSKFQNIYDEVIEILVNNLPEYLTYHSVNHTLYVLDKVEYIGQKEEVSKKDMFLLKIAALYHDIGFTKTHINHEKVGCQITKKSLEKHGLTLKNIEIICGMIMATKIPQSPKTNLEKVLADADLEYLGTKNFNECSQNLYQELLHFNPKISKKEWNNIQILFLTNHQYHTGFCKQYKEHRKLKNLERLK